MLLTGFVLQCRRMLQTGGGSCPQSRYGQFGTRGNLLAQRVGFNQS